MTSSATDRPSRVTSAHLLQVDVDGLGSGAEALLGTTPSLMSETPAESLRHTRTKKAEELFWIRHVSGGAGSM